jgi:hypothetical protein
MVRISSIDLTYLIAFVVASGGPYLSRRMAADRRLDRRRDDLCAGGLGKPKRFSEAFTIRDSGGVSVLSAGRKRESGYPTQPVRKTEGKWGLFYAPAVA